MARQTKGRIYKASSGTYFIEYRHAGKRIRKSLETTKKREAEKKAATILAPFRASSEVERRAAAVATMQTAEEELRKAVAEANFIKLENLQVPETYIKGKSVQKLKPSTLRANKSLLAGFIEKFMKKQYPDIIYAKDVTSDHVTAYCTHLETLQLSAHTFNLRIDVAGKAFTMAKLTDPFRDIPRKAKSPETREPLTTDQAKQLCVDATGEMKRLYALLLFTGLRVGDCATMQWKNIQDGRLSRRTDKTGAVVAFPMHPELVSVLDDVPEDDRQPRGFICPELASCYAKEQSSVSRMIVEDMQDHSFDTSGVIAGRARAVPRLGAHSFRHLFGRTMAKAGVPMAAVQKWLGHSSPTITRIYSEISPTAVESEIIKALPSLIEQDTSEDQRKAELEKDVSQILQKYEKNSDLVPTEAFKEDGYSLKILSARLRRAALNQIDGGQATVSRYAVWTQTVRNTILEAMGRIEDGEKGAEELLTQAANSLAAFAEIQETFDIPS